MKIASWNVNSINARLTHVTEWLQTTQVDVLLLQELKGTEFPAEAVSGRSGYESAAVTQKDIQRRSRFFRVEPIETVVHNSPW